MALCIPMPSMLSYRPRTGAVAFKKGNDSDAVYLDVWMLLVGPEHPFVMNGAVPAILTWEPMIASPVAPLSVCSSGARG